MTLRPEVIRMRLAHLARLLSLLERLRAMPTSERGRDPLVGLAAERALHVAAEAVFDMGHHVLAARGALVPATYREVIPALAALGVVDGALAVRLEGLAGMRNVLVHDYADIDGALVWGAIDGRLDDLRALHAAFAALVG